MHINRKLIYSLGKRIKIINIKLMGLQGLIKVRGPETQASFVSRHPSLPPRKTEDEGKKDIN